MEIEPHDVAAIGTQRRPSPLRHPVLVSIVALAFVMGGVISGMEHLDAQRDSLGVLDTDHGEHDALPVGVAPSDYNSRFLGSYEGYGVFGALTDDGEVCILALDRPTRAAPAVRLGSSPSAVFTSGLQEAHALKTVIQSRWSGGRLVPFAPHTKAI